MYGESGCGKTTTAKAIANALGKNILILNLSNVISARVGETAQNMKTVFDKAARDKAVLFLDEFDQIGESRGVDDRDAGELRRLINSMIQLIDYFSKDAILIWATNHQSFIYPALLRRFQLRIGFLCPSRLSLKDIMINCCQPSQLISTGYHLDMGFPLMRPGIMLLLRLNQFFWISLSAFRGH